MTQTRVRVDKGPFRAVARVERSEIRDHPIHTALPPPGFARTNPGSGSIRFRRGGR